MERSEFGVKESLCSSRSPAICSRGVSARRTLQQSEEDTPGNKRGTQLGGKLLCTCHVSLNHRTAPKHRHSAHTHHSSPSIVCKGPVGLRSLPMSVILDQETNRSDPFYIFLESTFKKGFRLFTYQSHAFRGRETPVKFLGPRPCQKSSDRNRCSFKILHNHSKQLNTRGPSLRRRKLL